MAAQGPPYIPFKLFLNKQWQLCYERYLAHIQAQGSGEVNTVRQYQYVLRSLFGDPHRTPDTYQSYEIEAFLSHTDRRKGCEGRPPSARTYNNRLGILQSFYSYAANYEVKFRNGYRKLLHRANPTANLNPLVTSQVNRTLTEEEVHRIFSAIPRDTIKGLRDRAIIRFYLLSGRRRNELIRLKWGDIAYERGQWVYRFKGKGRRDMDKDVMLPSVKEAIDAYLVASGRMETIQPGDALFTSVYHPDEGIGPGALKRMIKKYAELAGVRFSCHWFRHTHGYDFWIATDKDIMKVSKRLRHSSIEHTRRYLEAACIEHTRRYLEAAEVVQAPELAALEMKYSDV